MDLMALLDRISHDINELETGNLSELERDLLLADLRDLYVMVKDAKLTDVRKTEVIKKVIETPLELQTKEKVADPVIIHIEAEKAVEVPVVKTDVKQATVELTLTDQEEEATPISDPWPVITIGEIREVIKTQKSASLNEVFAGEEPSLNERLSNASKSAINDQASRRDLKSMIDLNKQFVLTNELFKGDGAAFQQAISAINDAPDIEAAFVYIKTQLLPKYQWSGEMQSARLFDKLVRQKFGV